MRYQFLFFSFFAIGFEILFYYFAQEWLWSLILVAPILIVGFVDIFQKKHTLMKNYPVVGRFRYVMEVLRPKIYQYFIESDTDGAPISRIFRSVVYQRAKGELSTVPFGTQLDVYQVGYEWINHSIFPLNPESINHDLRITVGGKDCKQPYRASIFNISAMSYGSLSANAIMALNGGAKLGKFLHNTGEGGLSPYHLVGGDVTWQIGTGYFGCRTEDGNFNPQDFEKKANLPNVKMIELKLSQGAKPGHGGILPAKKNTPEIAAIRGTIPWTTVNSPPRHKAFNDNRGLLELIAQMRQLSNGKPVGFKLCVGYPQEFEDLCKTMIQTKILPDFITVDGGEGGTGAAPLEFTNSIGMPFKEGLVTVVNLLTKYGLKSEIKVFTSGKILTGFQIVHALAIGADACNSARGMMLALGCIQALTCNSNHCPTGIATQDKTLMNGLDVEDKARRIHNFHRETVESVSEILAAAGLSHPSELRREHVWRRTAPTEIKNLAQVYPYDIELSKEKSLKFG